MTGRLLKRPHPFDTKGSYGDSQDSERQNYLHVPLNETSLCLL